MRIAYWKDTITSGLRSKILAGPKSVPKNSIKVCVQTPDRRTAVFLSFLVPHVLLSSDSGTRCLVGLPRVGGQCAHLLESQHAGADAFGLLTRDFRRSSAENGHLCVRTALSTPLSTMQVTKRYSMRFM